jgi:hypothetical protein
MTRATRMAAIVAAALIPAAALAQGTGTDPLPVTGVTNIPTYGIGVAGVGLAGAGDIACIQGSASKVVRVKAFEISATATTAIVVDVAVVLRQSLDSGGTPIAPAPGAPVRADPHNDPATATFVAFSAAPTPGTPRDNGTIRTAKLAVGAQGSSTGPIAEKPFTFYGRYDQAVVLRSPNDAACLNVGASGPGASYDIDAEWSETDYGIIER